MLKKRQARVNKNNNTPQKRRITIKSKPVLNPYFVTGFVDGEGSFSIRIRKDSKAILGFRVNLVFSIAAQVNVENLKLLENIKAFFGGIGSISKVAGNLYIYEVSSLIHFHKIRNHFDNYPLETTKLIHVAPPGRGGGAPSVPGGGEFVM